VQQLAHAEQEPLEDAEWGDGYNWVEGLAGESDPNLLSSSEPSLLVAERLDYSCSCCS
jgi:hypothetical protein